MSPLALRKQLLLAESELNRAQLLQEWQTMSQVVRSVTSRAKSLSSLALTAGTLMAGLTYFWRIKSAPPDRRPPWWQLLLKGVRLGASLWSEFGPGSKIIDPSYTPPPR
jgi:hypothetical protein